MAKKNVIPGGFAFSYLGRTAGAAMDLHKWVISISDSLMNRIAKHMYVKRDGAEKEPLGAADGALPVIERIVDDRFVVQVFNADREIDGFDRTAVRAQLRAADLELGLIFNFHRRRLKDGGLVRVLNPDKLEALRGGEHDDDYEEDR
mgnify:CR=1 FL=1